MSPLQYSFSVERKDICTISKTDVSTSLVDTIEDPIIFVHHFMTFFLEIILPIDLILIVCRIWINLEIHQKAYYLIHQKDRGCACQEPAFLKLIDIFVLLVRIWLGKYLFNVGAWTFDVAQFHLEQLCIRHVLLSFLLKLLLNSGLNGHLLLLEWLKLCLS